MAKNFSLSSMIPEPMTFTNVDGKKHDVRTTKLLGAKDFAKISRLQENLPAALERMNEAGSSDAEVEQAAEDLEGHLNDFFKLLVPTMPDDQIEKISFGDKAQFLDWWKNEQNPEETANTGK